MQKHLMFFITLCNLYGVSLQAMDTKTSTCCCASIEGTDCVVQCLQECECKGSCQERTTNQSETKQDNTSVLQKKS
jgi:hypothetical protein